MELDMLPKVNVCRGSQPLGYNSEGVCGNVVNQPRREFSAQTKRQAWDRANGFCEGWVAVDAGGQAPPVFTRCNAPIDLGAFHYDHIDPDWFSKDNELENCQVLCETCHKAKTGTDIKNIAKSKRIMDKRIKARKKAGFRGWRKFDGTVVHKR